MNVLFAPEQKSASQQNTKVLMDMLDKVTKERDQLKKQVKKKGKALADDVLASPDPPPEEDSTSTLLEIVFARRQAAEEADKRAAEAERRAKEAEKQAKAADLKHCGAETYVTTLEKKLDGELIEVQVSYMYVCKRQGPIIAPDANSGKIETTGSLCAYDTFL